MSRHLPALSTLLLIASFAWVPARASDGYHSIIVIPAAVDSPVFIQQFTFDTFNSFPVTVHVKFYPGQGTTQASIGPVTCPDVLIPPFDGTPIGGLRNLCPGLDPASVFGFLSMQAGASSDGTYDDIPLFAVNSRVSNLQGAGFVVEGIGSHNFSSGGTRVGGLNRISAGVSNPAYQSNCFIGNVNELAPSGTPLSKHVNFHLFHASSGFQTIVPFPEFNGQVDVLPGQLIRLLDVFAAAGAPAGDYQDYIIEFLPTGSTNRPGLMTFCTVQDNTSFNADVRIAKVGYGNQGTASEDANAARDQIASKDVLNRNFSLPAGTASNTHLVYFRRPDTVKCELLSQVPPLSALDGKLRIGVAPA